MAQGRTEQDEARFHHDPQIHEKDELFIFGPQVNETVKSKTADREATVSASSRRESVFKIDSPIEKQSKTANLGNLGNCKLKE